MLHGMDGDKLRVRSLRESEMRGCATSPTSPRLRQGCPGKVIHYAAAVGQLKEEIDSLCRGACSAGPIHTGPFWLSRRRKAEHALPG
jgi:hypothetical protein